MAKNKFDIRSLQAMGEEVARMALHVAAQERARFLDGLLAEPPRTFTPAQCFTDGVLYFTLVYFDPEANATGLVVTSSGECFLYTMEELLRRRLSPDPALVSSVDGSPRPRLPSSPSRLSPSSLRKFLAGGDTGDDPARLHSELRTYLSRFVEFPEAAHADLHAAHIMLTYLYKVIEELSILHITGPKESGKTLLVTLHSELSFNGILVTSISAPGLGRLVLEDSPTLCVDEAEELSRYRPTNELHKLLRAGYKGGARIVAAPGHGHRTYRVFCPLIVVNMGGMDSALRDRTIELLSTPNKAPVEHFSVRRERATIQSFRDRLYLYALLHAREVHERYCALETVPGLENRAVEIWRGLLATAQLVDSAGATPPVYEELLALACTLHQRRRVEQSFTDLDQKILHGTASYLSQPSYLGQVEPLVIASSLTAFIARSEDLPGLRIETVGRVLQQRRLILGRLRKRIPGGGNRTSYPKVHYRVDRSRLESLVGGGQETGRNSHQHPDKEGETP